MLRAERAAFALSVCAIGRSVSRGAGSRLARAGSALRSRVRHPLHGSAPRFRRQRARSSRGLLAARFRAHARSSRQPLQRCRPPMHASRRECTQPAARCRRQRHHAAGQAAGSCISKPPFQRSRHLHRIRSRVHPAGGACTMLAARCSAPGGACALRRAESLLPCSTAPVPSLRAAAPSPAAPYQDPDASRSPPNPPSAHPFPRQRTPAPRISPYAPRSEPVHPPRPPRP